MNINAQFGISPTTPTTCGGTINVELYSIEAEVVENFMRPSNHWKYVDVPNGAGCSSVLGFWDCSGQTYFHVVIEHEFKSKGFQSRTRFYELQQFSKWQYGENPLEIHWDEHSFEVRVGEPSSYKVWNMTRGAYLYYTWLLTKNKIVGKSNRTTTSITKSRVKYRLFDLKFLTPKLSWNTDFGGLWFYSQ